MNSDPYAHLSHLCGITAFSLPLRDPAPRPTPDLSVFGPIPDHLLSRYLCYQAPSPQLHPLLLHHPPPESLVISHRDSPQREILPPCVVNYQDSLYFTPERDSSSYSWALDSDYENWAATYSLPCEVNETPDDVLSGKILLSHIKKLALWHKDVSLDEKECRDMVSFMTSFSDYAFSTELPSRKKPKKHELKSKSVASSFHFTRSKSANRLSLG